MARNQERRDLTLQSLRPLTQRNQHTRLVLCEMNITPLKSGPVFLRKYLETWLWAEGGVIPRLQAWQDLKNGC